MSRKDSYDKQKRGTLICFFASFGGRNDSKDSVGNGETRVQTQEESESVIELESVAETKKTVEDIIEKPVETQKDEEKRIKSIVDTIVTPSMSDLERAIACHNWIMLNITGSRESTADTVTEVLDTKQVYAVGYTKIFYMMSKFASFECEYVEGNVIDNDKSVQPYAWNQIKIDGQWYNADITRDDNYTTIGFSYSYFLKADKWLASRTTATSILCGDENCRGLFGAIH